MEIIITISYIMLFCVVGVLVYLKIQLLSVGLTICEFLDFIKANELLDNLNKKSTEYEKFSNSEKLVFLMDSEKVFNILDKVPSILWEDLYPQYINVLNTYRDIKLLRWEEVTNC